MAVASLWALLLIFVVGFALGSIPWGVVIGKAVYHQDIRAVGSGNIGTTNAMRAFGHKGGIAVFLLDFFKGVVASLVALGIAGAASQGVGVLSGAIATQTDCLALAFFACIVGHVYSPWLGFHGGKGIAVAVGALFCLFGLLGTLVEIALFAVIVVATRYVSAGSVAAAVLCPFLAAWLFWGDWFAFALCTAAALIVIWAHRENIKRLASGTERRIGSSKEA